MRDMSHPVTGVVGTGHVSEQRDVSCSSSEACDWSKGLGTGRMVTGTGSRTGYIWKTPPLTGSWRIRVLDRDNETEV